MTPWTSLARRAGEAKGPDQDLDASIFEAMGWPRNPKSPLFVKEPGDDIYQRSAELTRSVDMALDLISEKLPERLPSMRQTGVEWEAHLMNPGGQGFTAYAATLPCALLSAFCLAMAAKAGEREDAEHV